MNKNQCKKEGGQILCRRSDSESGSFREMNLHVPLNIWYVGSFVPTEGRKGAKPFCKDNSKGPVQVAGSVRTSSSSPALRLCQQSSGEFFTISTRDCAYCGGRASTASLPACCTTEELYWDLGSCLALFLLAQNQATCSHVMPHHSWRRMLPYRCCERMKQILIGWSRFCPGQTLLPSSQYS